MTGIIMRLLNMFSSKHEKTEIDRIRHHTSCLDKRIVELEAKTMATINGDEKWMLELVKRSSPECALRVLKECEKNVQSR